MVRQKRISKRANVGLLNIVLWAIGNFREVVGLLIAARRCFGISLRKIFFRCILLLKKLARCRSRIGRHWRGITSLVLTTLTISKRGCVWGGVMSYCAKYMAKADCEFLSEISFGRSWGVFNRKCVPWAKIIEIDLDGEVGIRLRRVARHYLDRVCGRKRSRPYGVTLYCNVAQWAKLWESPPDTPF